jgi:hypothetical protein
MSFEKFRNQNELKKKGLIIVVGLEYETTTAIEKYDLEFLKLTEILKRIKN